MVEERKIGVMALDFIRDNPLSMLLETADSGSKKKTTVRKLSKKKFFVLMVLNLAVWLSVLSYYLEFGPATVKESMREFSRRRGLNVTGVVCNSKMQAAIISDEICNVGDTIKGFTITRINRDGVEFKKGRKTFFKEVASFQ